jgi:hypothetical protein
VHAISFDFGSIFSDQGAIAETFFEELGFHFLFGLDVGTFENVGDAFADPEV